MLQSWVSLGELNTHSVGVWPVCVFCLGQQGRIKMLLFFWVLPFPERRTEPLFTFSLSFLFPVFLFRYSQFIGKSQFHGNLCHICDIIVQLKGYWLYLPVLLIFLSCILKKLFIWDAFFPFFLGIIVVQKDTSYRDCEMVLMLWDGVHTLNWCPFVCEIWLYTFIC